MWTKGPIFFPLRGLLGRVLIKLLCKPLADVRFAPKATELLQRREMSRRPEADIAHQASARQRAKICGTVAVIAPSPASSLTTCPGDPGSRSTRREALNTTGPSRGAGLGVMASSRKLTAIINLSSPSSRSYGIQQSVEGNSTDPALLR